MGLWRTIHYALDAKGAAELDKRHRADHRAPSFWSEYRANRRASRWSDQYWRENKIIRDASTPLAHLQMDLGHGPNCPCRWCA